MLKAIIVVVLIVTFLTPKAYSQTCPCPLADGHFRTEEMTYHSHYNPANGVAIFSKSDTVNSVFSGKTFKVIANSVHGFTVVVQIESNSMVAYKHLSEVFVKTGDEVDLTDKIGVAMTGKDDNYEIVFSIFREKGREDPRPILSCKSL